MAWGDLHKILVIPLAHLHFLLPKRVLADDECPDSLLHQQIDDATASRVQIVHDAAIALRRDALKLTRSKAVGFGKLFLLMGALLTPYRIVCKGRGQKNLETRSRLSFTPPCVLD